MVGVSVEPDGGAVAGLESCPVFVRNPHPHDPVGPVVARNQVDRRPGRDVLACVGNLARNGPIDRRPNLSVIAVELRNGQALLRHALTGGGVLELFERGGCVGVQAFDPAQVAFRFFVGQLCLTNLRVDFGQVECGQQLPFTNRLAFVYKHFVDDAADFER